MSYRDKAQREICNRDVGEDSNRVVLFDRCAAIFEVCHSRDLLVLFVRSTSFCEGILLTPSRSFAFSSIFCRILL